MLEGRTRPITRSDLALFLPTHRLIIEFEKVVEDLTIVVPTNSKTLEIMVEEALNNALTGVADTASNSAQIETLKGQIEQLLTGPRDESLAEMVKSQLSDLLAAPRYECDYAKLRADVDSLLNKPRDEPLPSTVTVQAAIDYSFVYLHMGA